MKFSVGIGFRRAAAFLTRVPNAAPFDTSEDLASAVPWFPVVGALVGASVAGVYAGALQLTAPLPAAGVALTCGVLLTGAFHEDGLGDMADGFGGGYNRADTLRIMKDSRQGTYGVMAIALSLVIRLTSIAALPWRMAIVAITASHALSRASAVGLMRSLPAATEDGLGSAYLASLKIRRVAAGVASGLAIAAMLAGLWAAVAAGACAIAAAVIRVIAKRKIGGITGDVLGATQQICECVSLTLFAGVATHHWPNWGMIWR